MFDTKKFGAYLSRLRKNADMTQSDLAIRLNLTRQAISKYEVGDSFPDISILLQISDIFHIALNELINSGDPTKSEAEIFESAFKDVDTPAVYEVSDFLNVAPLLKPSVVDRLAQKLNFYGIDISNIVSLVQYLSEGRVVELLSNPGLDTLNDELLEKIAPFLDDDTKYMMIERVIEGKLDWHFLIFMAPFIEHYMTSQIEAAVLYGYLPKAVLDMLRDYRWKRPDKFD